MGSSDVLSEGRVAYPRMQRKAAAAGLEFRIVQRYLDRQELAAFRIASDILIHLPVSDALSGTVLETVYAGNAVITGSWLPYSPFRKAGLPLVTVENVAALSSCISDTLLRLTELKQRSGRRSSADPRTFFCARDCPTLGGNLSSASRAFIRLNLITWALILGKKSAAA